MHELLHLFNPASYWRLLVEIFQSLRRPVLHDEKPFHLSYLRVVVMVVILTAVFKIIAVLIKFGVDNYFGFDYEESETERSKLMSLLLVGLAGPFVEELLFRLPMRLNTRNLSVSVALGVVLFALGKQINLLIQPWFTNEDLRGLAQLLIKLLMAAALSCIIWLIIRRFNSALAAFCARRFTWIFYFFTLLFGFAHITNSALSWHNLLYVVPLTLPQLIGGLLLGYTRINLGLKYAIIQHSVWNFLALIPVLTGAVS